MPIIGISTPALIKSWRGDGMSDIIYRSLYCLYTRISEIRRLVSYTDEADKRLHDVRQHIYHHPSIRHNHHRHIMGLHK